MKTFKNGVGLGKDLADIVNQTRARALPSVMSALVDDCSTQSLAPILTGALRAETSFGISGKKTGTITWHVPYARRRWYEGSITGVPLWATVGMKRNEKKYRALIKKIFEEEKRN